MTTKVRIGVVGGGVEHPALTSQLSEREYAIVKVFVWFHMLKDQIVPTRWNKPTRKGTKIRFVRPNSQEEFDDAFLQFKAYMGYVNEKWDAGLEIEPPKEDSDASRS